MEELYIQIKMILFLLILTIILNATGDALTLNCKSLAHIVQALLVLLWLFILWNNDKKKFNWRWIDLLMLVISYALIRHGIFDYTWNLVAGQNMFFVGKTSFYDEYIAGSWLGIWPLRLFSLISGIILLRQVFKYKLKN